MSYNITISENGKNIICRVTGTMTTKTAQEFAKEMNSLSRAKNIKRFLYDMREAKNISATYEIYNFAYADMDDLGLERSARSAILADPADSSHDFYKRLQGMQGSTCEYSATKMLHSHGSTIKHQVLQS